MEVDANEVIAELAERLKALEVELATLRVVVRQQAAIIGNGKTEQGDERA